MKKSAIACGYIRLNIATSQNKSLLIVTAVRTPNSSYESVIDTKITVHLYNLQI